jgi:peroxiredoxin
MAFTLEIGKPAIDFDLPGTDGRRYSLGSFKDARILVVVFSSNHCPYVVGTEDRMIRFFKDYAPRGLAMVAINSNETVNHPTDSFEHMIERVKAKGFPYPYVRDETQAVARAYGALRTPHFYVFDHGRILRYTGRMDDSPRQPGTEKTHELRDAVDDVLAGRPVRVPLTNPIGCNVKWKGQEEHWMPAEACDLVYPGT